MVCLNFIFRYLKNYKCTLIKYASKFFFNYLEIFYHSFDKNLRKKGLMSLFTFCVRLQSKKIFIYQNIFLSLLLRLQSINFHYLFLKGLRYFFILFKVKLILQCTTFNHSKLKLFVKQFASLISILCTF
jgi:hypothetical protein